MIVKMLYICICVKNLIELIIFYEKVLGFKEVCCKDFLDFEFILVYMVFEEGGFELELMYNYD